MQIFVNTSLNESLRQALKQQLPAGHSVFFKNEWSEAEQAAAFQQSQVILGNPPAAWLAPAPPLLKYWQLDSAGFDGYKNLNLPNVAVCNLADYFSIPCAETIVAGILAFYRGVDELTSLKAEKRWVGAPIRFRLNLLTGKRVVILGAGSIGQAVKKMLSGFDCSVQMVARSHPSASIHSPEELLVVLPQTDLVINCLPGTAKGFFTAQMIDALPTTAVFANVGRGTTVDEPALIAALQQKRLAGAVLDVTEVEPLPTENPLWDMPNVILTQHTGGGQASEDEGKIAFFVKNFQRFLNAQPLENQIDLTRGY
ncbi:D-2-hydroxyacid dehydrogenase [Runella salmonicolor]|uniref:D-2-hydroxyacid dehydrogenase n=1 Tax=Runella salmonicolor TaxID=2950278 RepID=A0ABT1FQH2_9BACT|nr:D-2-hydroxyacid dehydrogenase [Runella salmonicolor]MCP1384024.1 D-2-hydroxyacid dehydrogenase [Runella salmonicolor]